MPPSNKFKSKNQKKAEQARDALKHQNENNLLSKTKLKSLKKQLNNNSGRARTQSLFDILLDILLDMCMC